MYPKLKTGAVELPTFGITIILGIIVSLVTLYYQAKKFRQPYRPLYTLTVYVAMAGVLGANLFDNLIFWNEMTAEEMVDMFNGHMFYGVFIGGLIAAFFITRHYKINFIKTLNLCIPAWLLIQVAGRVGCFLSGCCYGKQSDQPWAVTFHNPDSAGPLGIALHPTQLYEALAVLIIFILMIMFQKHKTLQENLFLIYAIYYAVIRFLIEFLRGDERGTIFHLLSTSQEISITIVLGYVFYLFKKKLLPSPGA